MQPHQFRFQILCLALTLAAGQVVGEVNGDEFRVNTTTDNDQWESDVAMDAQGNFVVVFQNHLPVTNANVSAQRYNAAGQPLGNEFLVNQTQSSDHTRPAIAMTPTGAFAVAWQDFGDDGSSNGIFMRRYDAQGVAQGNNVTVNTTTQDAQHRADLDLADDGRIVVVWEDVGPTGAKRRIRGQRYTAQGAVAGGEFDISTNTEIDHTFPKVAVDATGAFVVGWSAGNVGANQDVLFRRFAANGTALGDPVQVNTTTKMDHASGVVNNMSLDADSAGNFVVAWAADNLTANAIGIVARRYDNAGNPLGDAFEVNTNNPTDAPEVVVAPNGDFAIVYDGPDGSLNGVFAQRYAATGKRTEPAFRLNATTTLIQERGAIELLDDGRGVVAWAAGNNQDGDGEGVFARRFVDAQAPTGLTLASAVLPSSRSVQVGTPATFFATIINTHSTAAIDCTIALEDPGIGALTFQTTNPQTNALTGTVNTPADIPAANGSRSFVISLTPGSPIQSVDVEFQYDCTNSQPAPVALGLNTLLLSAATTPVPDIIALAATPTANGIVDVPGASGANAFAIATINVGVASTITASADTGNAALPLILFICNTTSNGTCITPPATSVTLNIAASATPTFTVFVNGAGNVPFDPAGNRIFVRFKDAGGVTRGSTSVATRTVP